MGLSSETYIVSSTPTWATKRNLIFEYQGKLSNNPHSPHCEADSPVAAKKDASNLCWESMRDNAGNFMRRRLIFMCFSAGIL